MPDRQHFATDGMVGVSGASAIVLGVSSNEGAGGEVSSWDVDGGGGVSSNQGGGGIIRSPLLP